MGVSVEIVRAMCNDGVLVGAVRMDGRWSIPPNAVEAWQRKQFEGAADSEGGRAAPAEVSSVPPGKESGPPVRWQHFRNNPWVFYSIAIISALIAVLSVFFALVSAGADFGSFSRQVKEWGLIREFPAEREGETLIIIARFYHSEGIADTEAHNEIYDAIEAAAKDLGESSLRVVVSSVPIVAEDQDRARKLGQMYDASIVIWGGRHRSASHRQLPQSQAPRL